MSKQLQAWAPPIVTYTLAAGAVSTAATLVAGNATGIIDIVLKTNQDVFIVFGTSGMGPATSGDMLLQAQDGWIRLRLRADSHYLRAIRSSSDAVIHYYLPGEAS